MLASPAALALDTAALYMSMRSNKQDSSPVAPPGAAGGEECDVTATLGAGGVTAGGVGAEVSSPSSSNTSFSSAYVQRDSDVYTKKEKIQTSHAI